MTANETIAVTLLDPALSRDARLIDGLAALINDVYVTAESGLWRAGTTRTTTSDLAGLIDAGEIAVADRDGELAGAIHVYDVAGDASGFGMLAAAPAHRGNGVGGALLTFAERHSRERGQRVMRLELLVPREWRHPSKEFLKGWYGRLGYRLVRTTTMDENYPQLARLLATPCELEIYEKPL